MGIVVNVVVVVDDVVDVVVVAAAGWDDGVKDEIPVRIRCGYLSG